MGLVKGLKSLLKLPGAEKKKRKLRRSFPANPHRYITGNLFKELCRYSFDEYGYTTQPKGREGTYFVKTDLLDEFFTRYLPDSPFTLVTHNADHGVTGKYCSQLDLPQLIGWYGQNVETVHPKLHSLPIGLCNFGELATFHEIVEEKEEKEKLVYANYRVETNPTEREACRRYSGVPLAEPTSVRNYLREIKRSYFVLSPNGNGVDCHRTWEALYLRAIPIVTRSTNSLHYQHLPMLIIDSWKDVPNLELSEELYHELMAAFDPAQLTVETFLPPIAT